MSSKRACIVSDKTISGFAQKIELQNMVLTGKCEGETKQESIIACSFEALLGAIYLEGGYIKAKEFLIKNFNENILNVDIDNPKAKLQELTQKISHKLPVYKILEESGPSHDKIYKIGAYYNDELVGVGVAKNKKDAEFIAAQEAYTKLTGEGEE